MKIILLLIICIFLNSCKEPKEEKLSPYIVDHINNEVEERFKPPFEAKLISYNIDKEIGNIRILLIDGHEYIHIAKDGNVIFTHKKNCDYCK